MAPLSKVNHPHQWFRWMLQPWGDKVYNFLIEMSSIQRRKALIFSFPSRYKTVYTMFFSLWFWKWQFIGLSADFFYIPHMFTYSLFQCSFRFPDVDSAVTLYIYYYVDVISIGTTGGSFDFVCVLAGCARNFRPYDFFTHLTRTQFFFLKKFCWFSYGSAYCICLLLFYMPQWWWCKTQPDVLQNLIRYRGVS